MGMATLMIKPHPVSFQIHKALHLGFQKRYHYFLNSNGKVAKVYTNYHAAQNIEHPVKTMIHFSRFLCKVALCALVLVDASTTPFNFYTLKRSGLHLFQHSIRFQRDNFYFRLKLSFSHFSRPI